MIDIQSNLDHLNHLTNLADKGWNGYESEPINQEAIKNAINMVNKVVVQPKIFPLANGNIQLEYYNRDKDMEYLELEVSENGIQDSTNENISIKELNIKLKEFYGLRKNLNEKLFRAIRPINFLWDNEFNRPSPAAFKDKNGLSVEKTGQRTTNDVLESLSKKT